MPLCVYVRAWCEPVVPRWRVYRPSCPSYGEGKRGTKRKALQPSIEPLLHPFGSTLRRELSCSLYQLHEPVLCTAADACAVLVCSECRHESYPTQLPTQPHPHTPPIALSYTHRSPPPHHTQQHTTHKADSPLGPGDMGRLPKIFRDASCIMQTETSVQRTSSSGRIIHKSYHWLQPILKLCMHLCTQSQPHRRCSPPPDPGHVQKTPTPPPSYNRMDAITHLEVGDLPGPQHYAPYARHHTRCGGFNAPEPPGAAGVDPVKDVHIAECVDGGDGGNRGPVRDAHPTISDASDSRSAPHARSWHDTSHTQAQWLYTLHVVGRLSGALAMRNRLPSVLIVCWTSAVSVSAFAPTSRISIQREVTASKLPPSPLHSHNAPDFWHAPKAHTSCHHSPIHTRDRAPHTVHRTHALCRTRHTRWLAPLRPSAHRGARPCSSGPRGTAGHRSLMSLWNARICGAMRFWHSGWPSSGACDGCVRAWCACVSPGAPVCLSTSAAGMCECRSTLMMSCGSLLLGVSFGV